MIPLAKKPPYSDLYTWSHVIDDAFIAHTDGAISFMIAWDGMDCELKTPTETAAEYSMLYSLYSRFRNDCVYEFHLWRDHDASLAEHYLARGADMERGGDFARIMRTEQAAHVSQFAMSNRVALVCTVTPGSRGFGIKRKLISQARLAGDALAHANELTAGLPGAQLLPAEKYLSHIMGSFDPARRGQAFVPDPCLLLSEQVITRAPTVLDNGYVAIGDALTCVLYLYLYPDAQPGWFRGLASIGVPFHASQIVKPIDTRGAMDASEKESTVAEGTLGRKGADYHRKQIRDISGFRDYVAEHNLRICQNAYVLHLQGTEAQLQEYKRRIIEWIELAGGQVRTEPYMQLPWYRAAMPGQGYCAPQFRPDHNELLINLAPLQVYQAGDPHPHSLRLGESGQLVGFDYATQPVLHSFTVAMTGGGKGVDKVSTIVETYPFGYDWYIAEIGGSYKWVVEAFGGTYNTIDPRETAVNPLPTFDMADPSKARPLDAIVAGSTVSALAFLLTGGVPDLNVDQKAAAQAALQSLYTDTAGCTGAPSLPALLSALESVAFNSTAQEQAGQGMASKLHSFLDTAEGQVFSREDNLTLSEGITGVDLKLVDRASKDLLQFYLIFIALKFNHLAFARRRTSFILLDEMHKFFAVSKDAISRLVSELARMGRKDAAFVDLVTQGIMEIDSLEKEVLNSMPLRSLLYRQDEHDHIASRVQMPDGVLNVWKQLPAPLQLPYRPGIRSFGDRYHHLHLTFPQRFLDLADTSPAGLDLKDEIGRTVTDPLERLHRFREAMAHA